MITISTNISEVYNDFNEVIKELADADKVLRTVAHDGLTLITDRVQQQGKKSDGSNLKTKSKSAYGAYSEKYGKLRQDKGRQTDIVDLTNSGDMFTDFIVEPTGEREYSVGFRGDKSAAKAEYMEDYYGPIFSPSEEEESFLLEQLNKHLDEIFK